MKIILKPHQRIWFMSDPHYNHKNICRGVSSWDDLSKTRDFKTLDEMNDVIVRNINNVVAVDDILFCLGDWSFGGFDKIRQFRDRIVCQNIHLILGNHDHHIENNKDDIQEIFESVNHLLNLEIKIPNVPNSLNSKEFIYKKFVLCHYPIASWQEMGNGVIHLHGHVHLPPNQKLHEGRAMDVGLDGNYMAPYSLQEIAKIMKNRPIKGITLPSDHHQI